MEFQATTMLQYSNTAGWKMDYLRDVFPVEMMDSIGFALMNLSARALVLDELPILLEVSLI